MLKLVFDAYLVGKVSIFNKNMKRPKKFGRFFLIFLKNIDSCMINTKYHQINQIRIRLSANRNCTR